MHNIVIDMKKNNNLCGIQSLVVLKGKKKKNSKSRPTPNNWDKQKVGALIPYV